MTELLLRTTEITKRYGSVTVLDGIEFEVAKGEIHGLIGANGAGKSTLCKIISGLVQPTSGTMSLAGENYDPATKQDAERKGVEIVQQELNLIPTLSVAENLLLTDMPNSAGVIRQGELHRRARSILDQYGLQDVATTTQVSTLGVGRQQMLEIATALGRDCKLLILDEPTAALSNTESEQLFRRLVKLRAKGVSIIYISHRLAEIKQLCDRVTVLRDGTSVGIHQIGDLSTERMVELMTGESDSTASSEFTSHATTEVVMQVDRMNCGVVQDVSLTVHRGERLGIAGLVGSGRTELLRCIFGADVATSGTVQVGDRVAQTLRSPRQAVDCGIAMVTEDRKQNGLLLSQSIRANTTMSSLARLFSTFGIIKTASERLTAEAQCRSLETRCQNVEQAVGTLSGGNQQKIAISKWLVQDADVFLFDEPTRGIDVAARQKIHGLFETLAASGRGIVMVSSDTEELLATCDRIAVMSDGRLAAVVERDNWNVDVITKLAFSGYVES